jgi:hypothetical protein
VIFCSTHENDELAQPTWTLNQSVFPLHHSRLLRRWIEEQTSMSGLPGICDQLMTSAFYVTNLLVSEI